MNMDLNPNNQEKLDNRCESYILNYGVNEEELTALLSKKMKNITVQELDEAGFEVGIGDIDKFDEVCQGFDSLVEKTKEETKEGGKNIDE